MAKIRKLSPHIADLIAAGEVVERPMSVVKELLENSIDAKATQITIEIQNGGISYIRIADNGIGMSREDASVAFLRHATSKIYEQSDLEAIKTLGFRGEALAAISSVSKIDLFTKRKEDENATFVNIVAGEVLETTEIGASDGTTIIVRDLFFNTPARMKFLKKDYTEASYISSIIENLALSNPQISFKFIKDNKLMLNTIGNNDLKSVIYNVLGKEDTIGLLEVLEYEMNGFKINGFISKPNYTKGNRSKQHFFVNKRYIKSRIISAAIEEAYKNSIMHGKFPYGVLNIELNENLVDVNVHPTKTEVKFANEKSLFETVYFGIKETITKQNIIAEPIKIKPKLYEPEPIMEQIPLSHVSQTKSVVDTNAFVRRKPDVFYDNPQEPVIKESIVPEKSNQINNVLEKKVDKTFDVGMLKSFSIDTELSVNSSPISYNFKDESEDLIKSNDEKLEIKTNADVNLTSEEKFNEQIKEILKPFRYIGECFNTFIICQYDNELILIDKHAAHERLNFNKLLKHKENINSQMLLTPVVVELSSEEYGLFIENLDEINKLGFEIEDFKDKTIVVRQIPMILDSECIEDLVFEISRKLMNNAKIEIDKIDDILHSIACKSAIKGNQYTSDFELEQLARDVVLNEEVNFCPHGRPVKVGLTKYNVEKMFKRIL